MESLGWGRQGVPRTAIPACRKSRGKFSLHGWLFGWPTVVKKNQWQVTRLTRWNRLFSYQMLR